MTTATPTYSYTTVINDQPIILDLNTKITQDDVIELLNRVFWVKKVELNVLELTELKSKSKQ